MVTNTSCFIRRVTGNIAHVGWVDRDTLWHWSVSSFYVQHSSFQVNNNTLANSGSKTIILYPSLNDASWVAGRSELFRSSLIQQQGRHVSKTCAVMWHVTCRRSGAWHAQTTMAAVLWNSGGLTTCSLHIPINNILDRMHGSLFSICVRIME